MKASDKTGEETLNDTSGSSSKKLIKVQTPKKVVTKDITLISSQKNKARVFPSINTNMLKAERKAKIDKIKTVLAQGGGPAYLNTHSVEDLIDCMGQEVSLLKEMIEVSEIK